MALCGSVQVHVRSVVAYCTGSTEANFGYIVIIRDFITLQLTVDYVLGQLMRRESKIWRHCGEAVDGCQRKSQL